MTLLKKLFGKKDPESLLRGAFERHEWAEVVRLGEDLSLDSNEELVRMSATAREKLAELNLREAHTRFSQGDAVSGQEHLELAKNYGASDEQVDAVGSDFDPPTKQASAKPVAGHDCSTCATPAGPAMNENGADESAPDWDLLLAGFPAETARAYMAKSDQFRRALLKCYEGLDDEACELFRACEESDIDPHFAYEYGSALCRCGHFDDGIDRLLGAVEEFPEHRLAWDVLFEVDAGGQRIRGLKEKVIGLERVPGMRGFSAAALVRIGWQEGDLELVLEKGQVAHQEGEATADILQMMAAVHEQKGEDSQAENLLSQLPSGGCGGGAHPALAEFWLRKGKQLDVALESFKAGSRQEPDNPRWMLRIAQTYLAKGWRREGLKLMNQLARFDQLPDHFREEVAVAMKEATTD